MRLNPLAILIVLLMVSCGKDYDNEFVTDYYFDFSEFPSTKTKVFKDLNSGEYIFYDIGLYLDGRDTIAVQVSYDVESKYDSSLAKIRNKSINLIEAYSFRNDSAQQMDKVEVIKFPYDVKHLTQDRIYETGAVISDDEKFYSKTIIKFEGFDSITIKNKTHYCAVMVNYADLKINDERIGSPTDTVFLEKNFGMLRQFVDFYDEPKLYVLDTVISTDQFRIENYKN